MALLQSDGIDCYLRNEYTTQVMGRVDVGGVRVELLEGDVARALQIMGDHGYEIPKEDEQPDQIKAISGWASHVPFLRNLSLEKQILVLFLVIALFLALLIFMYPLLTL
jgi:hypothetical protein